MILGITGLIGSGKTTVAKLFSKHHFNRIDADKIGHELLKLDKKIKDKIIKEFGKEILDNKNNVDRKRIGNIVFNSQNKLKKLNSIMHPAILNEIENQIKKIQKKCGDNAKIIIDAPLLLETDADELVDKVIVVKAFNENIVARNKQFSIRQLERIAMTQMSLAEKLKKAHFMIDNTKDLKHLKMQVKDIVKNLN